jgi:hypothetical protein
MTAPIKQASFARGEIAPTLYGRTDTVMYETGLRVLRNRITMRHGGVTRRPGTQYVGTALNGGNPVRLIPFIFNETGNGQSYVLEFGNQYVAFYQNGGVVVSGGNPYTITSPYLQADLSTLKFDESADVITITHPSYAVYELKRIAATNWTLTTVTFGPIQPKPVSIAIQGTVGTDPPVSYYVTAVGANGEESYAITQTTGNSLSLASPTKPVLVTVTGSAVAPLASFYNVYKSSGGGTVPGFIGRIPAINTIGIDFGNQSLNDNGITPDYTNTIPLSNSPFASVNNYPSVVAYAQQRRWFANTNNNPIGFWSSQPGLYANFNIHTVPTASDSIVGSIAGREVNAIQHILELKFLLMLTAGSELYIQGNGTGVVTPSAINASVQSQYGANPLRPLRLADTVIFNQALGSFVRDLAFDFVINGYRGNDLTVFSSHLVEGFSLVDWDFQKIPDSIVWAVRNDGVLLGLTYMREQQVFAWHRHDFTNGTVENVCCIPENGNYAVYLCIKRIINGATVRYIERMSSRIWSDILNATYLDCFSSFNGTNTGSNQMILTVPGGGAFDGTSSAYQQHLTLSCTQPFFTSAMVGNQILLSDSNFIKNQGNMVDPENDGSSYALSTSGNQIRCTILSFTSSTQVTITPNKAVPVSLQAIYLTTWSRAVQKVTGLNYLIGQQVAVWADRFVVGSPFNNQISTVYTVAADGSLTLDQPYSVIFVGLPMVSDFETLDMETAFGETIISKRKKVSRVALHLYQTRTLFAGSENPDTNQTNLKNDPLWQLFELQLGENRATYDQAPELITSQEYVHVDSEWNKNGRIFIRDVDPVPSTILAVSPFGDNPASSPYYERA